jgi:hypothetical protein
MQKYIARLGKHGRVEIVPDENGDWVSDNDAEAEIRQAVKKEREEIIKELEGPFTFQQGHTIYGKGYVDAMKTVIDHIKSRSAKEPECCCHKPGMERPAGTPCPFCPIHGEPMKPEKIEPLNTLDEIGKDVDSYAILSKINQIAARLNEHMGIGK